MRLGWTSRYYAHDGFPSPDYFLTRGCFETCGSYQKGKKIDVFLAWELPRMPSTADTRIDGKCSPTTACFSVEMESSPSYHRHHARIESGHICAVSGNLVTSEVIYDKR